MSTHDSKKNRSLFDDLFDVTRGNSIFRAMDQLFADAFSDGIQLKQYETKTDYVIETALPGVSKEEIHLELVEDSLRMMIDHHEKASNDTTGQTKEMRSFRERTISLPANISKREMRATYQDGVLSITFPKRRGKRIEIE
ncbi:Hsp20/alpha crystallin family protein [Pontibacillus litoralis]|uniref:SHSP domain-containing protein n=1 Tax=Pontibacillus litoralis JSM 072002 TaxID=1385512 RepID=A0A0A5G7L7_9BACI|nr:Hsp20/alpha crystallin family protein [Pontibacillus litoralis]KGX87090.1 hypothetical protein N784_02880 [Pontibacillus litoralis JSM 072002]